MRNNNKIREPTLMACEEGVPVPPQSVISRVETFISGIQRHRDGTWDQERRPIPTPRGKKEAAKGGGERSVQPSERCQQGTGRWTDSTSLFFPRTIHLESTIKQQSFQPYICIISVRCKQGLEKGPPGQETHAGYPAGLGKRFGLNFNFKGS